MKTSLCLPALALLFTSPARAQKPDIQPPPGVSSQLQGLLGGALKPAAKKSAVPSTKFQSTGKPLFVDALLEKMTLDDAQKDAFRKYTAQVIALTETAYQQNGYAKNDLGVAFAGLLEVCYEMDHDEFTLEEKDPVKQAAEKKKTASVVRQFQQALGSTGAFQKIPDKSKQLAYEACAFTTGHLAVTWQQAGTDETKRAATRALARQQIQALFRFDPDAITRSPTGEFVAKKAAKTETAPDVAKPDSADAPPQPAESPTSPAEKNEAPPRSDAAPEQPAANNGPAPAPAPKGWTCQRLTGGAFLYTSPQSGAGDDAVSWKVAPRRPLGGQTIEAWMQAAIAADPAPPGKPATAPQVKAASDNFVSGSRLYTRADGKPVIAIYTGFSPDKETIRLVRITAINAAALTREKDALGALARALSQADKNAAVDAGRGLDIEKLPPTPPGMTPGGPLKEGVYTGNQLYGAELRDRFRLYLYKDGEYRLFNESKELSGISARTFTYNPRSGKLNLAYGSIQNMSNNSYEPDQDYCLYGRNAEGKPYVYAYSNRGFSDAITRLVYAGPLDRPSMRDEENAKAAAIAEAKRYKWVVPAGQGLKDAQIAGILLNQELNQFYNGSGLSASMTYDLYLLLSDGTIYNGLPVPPDELDVSLSRRREPEKWGRWRKEKGRYLAAWPDAPNQFRILKGEIGLPAAGRTKLAGRYGSGESSGTILGGSYRLWGATFTPEGQFVKDEHGGYGSSITAQNSGMANINSAYDEAGSFTAATGENFVVSSEHKKKPDGSRAGTYSLNGYTLSLHYANGKTVRLPFFFGDAKRKSVWFEGAMLSLDEPKK